MGKEENKRREEELDRFWDIDALLPKKQMPRTVRSDTETTEIVLEPKPTDASARETRTEAIAQKPVEKQSSADAARRFIPPHTAEEFSRRLAPEKEYTPDNALIRHVRIYPWKSNYRYYEGFVSDAAKLYAVSGADCPRVPFFSYVPQYTQMNRSQLEWYLWWRACARRGEFLDTDYSYVLLYAYELINLSDRTDPAEAQGMLCKLWIHYRDTFHQLDSYLPEWICDLSLLHSLPPPAALMGDLLPQVMAHCTLREFYLPGGGEDGYLRALLAFCSNYNYRKSKFCVGERVKLFDATVMGALREVSKQMSEDGKLFAASGMDDSTLIRDAYTGALCSYRIKRRIEIEYCSFSRSHELRFFITDVVKYTENRLRASLGIRSRLSVYALSGAVRAMLDEYLDARLPKKPAATKKQEEPTAEYEKLYDLPRMELSLSNAAEIERLSWETTERLVDAFVEEQQPQKQEEIPLRMPTEAPVVGVLFSPIVPTGMNEDEDALREALDAYLPLLRAILKGDITAQKLLAKEKGIPLEVLADEINAAAAAELGDILLEESGAGFSVLEDYRELLERML